MLCNLNHYRYQNPGTTLTVNFILLHITELKIQNHWVSGLCPSSDILNSLRDISVCCEAPLFLVILSMS
jgi:hypothetical protein